MATMFELHQKAVDFIAERLQNFVRRNAVINAGNIAQWQTYELSPFQLRHPPKLITDLCNADTSTTDVRAQITLGDVVLLYEADLLNDDPYDERYDFITHEVPHD